MYVPTPWILCRLLIVTLNIANNVLNINTAKSLQEQKTVCQPTKKVPKTGATGPESCLGYTSYAYCFFPFQPKIDKQVK